MDELISKRAVIEAIEKARANVGHNLERSIGKSIIEILDDVGRDVDRLPSALSTNWAEVGTDCISRQQAACEYCHEDSDGYVKPIEKNCHAFISFGMDGWELSLQAKGWHGSAKIKYCPMCGRKLKR